jgi:putative transposase
VQPDAGLTELSDTLRQQALERYRKLQPHLEQNIPLLQVARNAALGPPLQTLRAGGFDPAWSRRPRQTPQHFTEAAPTHGRSRAAKAAVAGSSSLSRSLPDRPGQGEPLPGYHSIYRAINAVSPAFKTLAHEEAAQSNELWQADHTQLDFYAKRNDGQVARPWLTTNRLV